MTARTGTVDVPPDVTSPRPLRTPPGPGAAAGTETVETTAETAETAGTIGKATTTATGPAETQPREWPATRVRRRRLSLVQSREAEREPDVGTAAGAETPASDPGPDPGSGTAPADGEAVPQPDAHALPAPADETSPDVALGSGTAAEPEHAEPPRPAPGTPHSARTPQVTQVTDPAAAPELPPASGTAPPPAPLPPPADPAPAPSPEPQALPISAPQPHETPPAPPYLDHSTGDPAAAAPRALTRALPPAGAQVPAFTRSVLRRVAFTVTPDGAYAACLAQARTSGAGEEGEAEEGAAWFAERWTLGGPQPYAVPLPGVQPEEPGTRLTPLADGRVLAARRVADRHDLVLLYPSGGGTGQVPAGSLPGPDVRLLPPAPVPGTAFALSYDAHATTVWRVHGTAAGVPERVMTIEGRCTGGVWLDRRGRLLALDRALDGRTKAVAADLHTGSVSPLLQLTEDSDDRLLLAEPDSGLLVLRSDAAGGSRLGWGVLGSRRPVRFPSALRVPGTLFTPVAAQPGQSLSPESTVVALRAEVPGGPPSLALWRPGERGLHWRAAPRGWMGPVGVWLPGSELRLPYVEGGGGDDCGLVPYALPPREPVTRPALAAGSAPDGEEYEGAAPGARLVSDPRRPAPAHRPLAVLPLQEAPLPRTDLR